MRILGILLGTAGLAALALAPGGPAAATMLDPGGPAAITPAPEDQAEPVEATAACSGGDVVSAAYVRRFGDAPAVGAIQLRRDSCSRYWAVVIMYDALPANALASAYLTRYDGSTAGTTWSCDSSGGTDPVLPGQTNCRTPKVKSTSGSQTFLALGYEWNNGGGGYTKVSWGQTARTR
jgi:hypothetical protein